MALPKLETPTYTLTLPSNDEEVKYRPFLVKEQKRIMMAQESENEKEMIDAMKQLIRDCTFKKVDPNVCPVFDAEYIFLQIRSKSVGEKVRVNVTCPDDKKTKVTVTLNLDDIECNMTEEHTNIVEITDKVKIFFNYPLLSSFKSIEKINQTEAMFNLVSKSIKEIHFDDKIFNKIDMSEKELTDFIESLSTEQFKRISDFFETMPRLRHVVKVTNPETKVEGEVLLQGLQSFLV